METLTEEQYKRRVEALIRFARKGYWQDEYELTEAERDLYKGMQNLYASFRQGLITVEEGKKQKSQLINRFWSHRKEETFRRTMAKHYSDMKIRIESAANAYAKNRTLENADLLYKALYGMMPNKEEET